MRDIGNQSVKIYLPGIQTYTTVTPTTDPGTRLGFIMSASLVGTVSGWILFGLLTSPVLYYFIQRSAEIAGMAFLGVSALGIWFGQKILENEFREYRETIEEELELNWTGQAILSMTNITYYNVLLYLSVSIGLLIASAGYPTVGVLFSFLYPAYDLESIYRGIPFSLGGLVAFSIALIVVALSIKEESSWRDIDLLAPVERLIGFKGGRSL